MNNMFEKQQIDMLVVWMNSKQNEMEELKMKPVKHENVFTFWCSSTTYSNETLSRHNTFSYTILNAQSYLKIFRKGGIYHHKVCLKTVHNSSTVNYFINKFIKWGLNGMSFIKIYDQRLEVVSAYLCWQLELGQPSNTNSYTLALLVNSWYPMILIYRL